MHMHMCMWWWLGRGVGGLSSRRAPQCSWHSASVTACQMGSVCIVVGPAHPPALRPGPGGCQRATLLGPRVVKTGV